MDELIITTSDKDLLTDIQSAAIDGIVINKSIVSGRKLRIVRGSAILTNDTSLINSAVDIAVNFTSD